MLMYSKIINPITNRYINISSKIGKKIIYNYLKNIKNKKKIGGTILIKNKFLDKSIIADNRIYIKGRSKEYDILHFNNDKLYFDIDFSINSTSYNEVLILHYVLQGTGIHKNTSTLDINSCITYKYNIIPYNNLNLKNELSFNILQFLDDKTLTKIDINKYNCCMVSNEYFEKIKKTSDNFKNEFVIDSKEIIFLKNIWNDIDEIFKFKIVNCMALSIHYRIDQQYFFSETYEINKIELDKYDHLSQNDIEILKIKEYLKPVEKKKMTNIESFIRHQKLIIPLYQNYRNIIQIESNEKNKILLLNILNGSEKIYIHSSLWYDFYNTNPNCKTCQYLKKTIESEREKERFNEIKRIIHIIENNNLEFPNSIKQGRLYIPHSQDDLNSFFDTLNLDEYKKNLLIKICKFRYKGDINNIIKISEITKIKKILINIEIYNKIRENENNLEKLIIKNNVIDKDNLLIDDKINKKREILEDSQKRKKKGQEMKKTDTAIKKILKQDITQLNLEKIEHVNQKKEISRNKKFITEDIVKLKSEIIKISDSSDILDYDNKDLKMTSSQISKLNKVLDNYVSEYIPEL